MKEKMLTKLERDRAVGQVAGLQSTLKNLESMRGTSASVVNKGAVEEFCNLNKWELLIKIQALCCIITNWGLNKMADTLQMYILKCISWIIIMILFIFLGGHYR